MQDLRLPRVSDMDLIPILEMPFWPPCKGCKKPLDVRAVNGAYHKACWANRWDDPAAPRGICGLCESTQCAQPGGTRCARRQAIRGYDHPRDP